MYTDGHVTTDPACRFHVHPIGWLARRRYDKARGYGCPRCCPPPKLAQENLIAIREELALLRAMEVVRKRLTASKVPPPGSASWDYLAGYQQGLKDVLLDLGHSSSGPMTPSSSQEK